MRRRTVVAVTTLILAAGVATGAEAMVSAVGSGQGKATVVGRGDVKEIEITGDAVKPLKPGTPAVVVGTFRNPNDFPLEVAAVRIEITKILGAAGTCSAADFATENAHGPWDLNGGQLKAWQGGSVTLLNDATHSPNGCLGATIRLKLTAS